MSIRIRNTIFNLIEGSSGGGWTPQRILDTFGSRMVLWTSKDDEKAGYYVNKIGIQEREAVTEGAVAGILHPGRAISYDGSKSQYSRTVGNAPLNFKIGTNSLTIFFRLKVTTTPTGDSLCCGYVNGVNGYFYCYLYPDGRIIVYVWHSTGSVTKVSNLSVCDGLWHDVYILIDKTGNFGLYIDNVLQSAFTDISTLTFGVSSNEPFHIGGQTSRFSGIKCIRDLRIWPSAITSDTDRDTIHNGGYVAGCASWYFMEEGKESTVNLTNDCVGNNNLNNIGFDGTSLVSGVWPSLLNKFGYSAADFIGTDLILGDGDFADAAEWYMYWPLRLNVTGGKLVGYSTDGYVRNNRVISYLTTDILHLSFDITGTAVIAFLNQSLSAIKTLVTYTEGHYDIYFNPLTNGSGISIGNSTANTFTMDNFIIEKNVFSNTGIFSPKMDAVIPTNDILGRVLIFKDQAKYNLIKVSESVVKLPDYIGELFNACENISINDWYDANGVGNEIALIDIEPYQTEKQYYNNEELILIKD